MTAPAATSSAHRPAPRTLSTRPRATCPDHPGVDLEGGHVQYRCPRGHRVQAADLNREVTR